MDPLTRPSRDQAKRIRHARWVLVTHLPTNTPPLLFTATYPDAPIGGRFDGMTTHPGPVGITVQVVGS
jgi:hypothetical protein